MIQNDSKFKLFIKPIIYLMRTTILFLTTLIFQLPCFSQSLEKEWAKFYGGSQDDGTNSSCIQKTNDGGYILATNSNSSDGDLSGNQGSYDIWIIKISVTGAIEWQKSIGNNGYEFVYSIQQTNDGGYIAAGESQIPKNFLIIKLSSIGNIEWQKSIGGGSDTSAKSIRQTTDGGFIVAGTASINGEEITDIHGMSDFLVVKLTALGGVEWKKSYGGSDEDAANSIQQTTDGGYVVAGFTKSSDGDVVGYHGMGDCWVIKLNSSGELKWQNTYGTLDADEEAKSIELTSDGGYIVAGNKITSQADYLIVKLNSLGKFEWKNTYAKCAKQTLDGGYILYGDTFSSNSGDIHEYNNGCKFWLVKLDNNGELQWGKMAGLGYYCFAGDVIQTADQGYIMTGSSGSDGSADGYHGGNSDLSVIKLSPFLSTNHFKSNVFKLYPNPATHQINLQSSNTFMVDRVVITDLTGKIIMQQTENTNTINIEKLNSGIYLLQGFSGEQKFQSKFIKE